MAFQPAESLNNRTFIGLIVAQFLAGFNDQAIHASAMFYAIHQNVLTEAQAITLMPMLFYAPWAIFCTLSGYLADRYSKTTSLRTWKVAEIAIALMAIAGFYLGTTIGSAAGAWMVLSTVFLMGTHAAFFAPAKYGAMPEILQPHILSKGNGILESTTFLAAILGTVTGGLLSFKFRNQEIWIGVILLALAVIGAVASFLIAYLPASNPERSFPKNLFKPLIDNLKVLFKSRPLALAVLGIAFFIFMVTYMRSTMYMHGQTRNPPWNEFDTSLVVATVALGVGLGSPLAGFLSGGKIELGLVPLGCLGMIAAALLGALEINQDVVLVIALIIMGFFSGFYMVPLYTLLQHRAPKKSKGELVATSNFVNVTGAMLASLLFGTLVQICILTNITPEIPQKDVARGTLAELKRDDHGKIELIVIETPDGEQIPYFNSSLNPEAARKYETRFAQAYASRFEKALSEDFDGPIDLPDAGLLGMFGRVLNEGDEVIVSALSGTPRFFVRSAEQPTPKPQYDNEGLPRFLFLGAALMTLAILVLLVRKLPDLFVRTWFWRAALGRFRIKAVNMQNLPTSGAVILATNCDRLESALQLVSATDRTTTFILVEETTRRESAPILRSLAASAGLVEVPALGATPAAWTKAKLAARAAMVKGSLLAVTINGQANGDFDQFLAELRAAHVATPIVPVYCGSLDGTGVKPARIRVVFGQAVSAQATLDDLRRSIHELGEWIRVHDHVADSAGH